MANSNTEKITFNMPVELKNQVMQLKDELKVSLSTIYNEAVKNYVQQKELERWRRRPIAPQKIRNTPPI